MTTKQRWKEKLAFIRSYFTRKPIITGRGFTTSDESLPDQKLPLRKPGLATYRVECDVHYTFVGAYRVSGRNIVRLLPSNSQETIELEQHIFKKLFKLI